MGAKAESPIAANRESLPCVAVCILNWNGWRDTLKCLDSLCKQDYPHRLTLVVDNDSQNDSREKIRSWAGSNLGTAAFAEYTGNAARAGGDVRNEEILEKSKSTDRMVLIRNEGNTGFTGGCNTAFDYALNRPEPVQYVFLLNNDTTLEPDCITRLVDIARDSGAAVVGAVVMDESGSQPIFNGRISMRRQFFSPIVNWHLPPPAIRGSYWSTECAHGGAMMVASEALRAIHRATGDYFRTALFMYHEGAEFHYHAARLGHRTVVARDAVVRHKNAGSSGGTENPLAYYYSERNRILVANVVLPIGWRVLFHLVNPPLISLRILKNVVRGRWTAALGILNGLSDAFRGRAGKWRRHDEQSAARGAPNVEV